VAPRFPTPNAVTGCAIGKIAHRDTFSHIPDSVRHMCDRHLAWQVVQEGASRLRDRRLPGMQPLGRRHTRPLYPIRRPATDNGH
jgi:hypothetical protein